jgi:hypothetical protein
MNQGTTRTWVRFMQKKTQVEKSTLLSNLRRVSLPLKEQNLQKDKIQSLLKYCTQDA